MNILNGPHVDPELLRRRLTKCGTPHVVDEIVAAYTTFGRLSSIGNLYPFAQAMKETAGFTSPRWVQSYNPAGIGATSDATWGHVFTTPAEGIIAQYAHLLAYALKIGEGTPVQTMLVTFDPRLAVMGRARLRGAAQTWEALSGKWSSPGNGYGESIVKMAEAIKKL
jgi:N-acetylmuramoyl-L-alanine amidase